MAGELLYCLTVTALVDDNISTERKGEVLH